MTLDKQIEVMQAFLENKRIEEKMLAGGKWHVCTAPSWNWATYEYRVRQTVDGFARCYRNSIRVSDHDTTSEIIINAYKAGWEQHAKTTKSNH